MDRLLRAVFLLLSIVPVILAQYGGSGGSGGSGSSSSTTSATSPDSTMSGAIKVDVGEDGGLIYKPDTMKASTGDTIQFTFYPQNHSVVQSAFDKPCQPQQNGIFSGFMPVSSGQGNMTFTITINDTKPIWLYCAQTAHCQSGMAMVINPPSSGQNTLNAYKNAAKNTSTSTAPAAVQGGVVGSNQTSPSSSSTGSSPSSSATSKSQASNSVSRSWVGVVVGAIFSGLWAAWTIA
ncbi:hypothetical protein Egran_02040 [Elaphomyces granulatus]|uniref:Phytocyanin domain-containing protein n=1 Tax=Elaphomyces granulatus TaxID=519963 RepID=A0A232M1B8_9EURO|nr:hypothetical protein Egran_02040 [Elaphomyces granulatus]